MSFRNQTPMHNMVVPVLLMAENGRPVVRKGENGWEMSSVGSQNYGEWRLVTNELTAAVLDQMLAAGEIVLDEHKYVRLMPGPWGLRQGGF